MSEEKNEGYPQLKIHPNGTYNLLVEEDVQIHFRDAKSIEEYIKNKNIQIIAGHKTKHVNSCLVSTIEF